MKGYKPSFLLHKASALLFSFPFFINLYFSFYKYVPSGIELRHPEEFNNLNG